MRLARGTDFAYRILMLVAMNRNRSLTIDMVAETLGLSKAHVMKLIAKLSSHGFLETTRGRGGGMHLGKEPKDIRLGDVAHSMEADFGMVECLYRNESHCAMFGGCELTFIMHRAVRGFLDILNEYSLEDILEKSQNSPDLIMPACFQGADTSG
ncbi:MAG: Rrf2 family transcriptional regulator [Cohaesibacter sp.]|jgi:Rrf2 family nitric oxide-sensitive transcriptional repressor|nr:Rrf2 family transcriptional regulator [Cohaesibacter sp.]